MNRSTEKEICEFCSSVECCSSSSAVHVAQTQVKRMIKWQNANKEEQEAILNHVKMHVMQEREHQDLSDK